MGYQNTSGNQPPQDTEADHSGHVKGRKKVTGKDIPDRDAAITPTEKGGRPASGQPGSGVPKA